MNHEIYEAKIFQMEFNPATKRKTICLEVELDDYDFNELKGHWVDNETVDIKITNID